MNISYFPVLGAPDCHGWTTVCNFPPNNWETTDSSEKFVNVTWSSGAEWRSENIGVLASGDARTVRIQDLAGLVPDGVLPLLSLTLSKLPSSSDRLPQLDVTGSSVPAWRATIGLSTVHASTSYQGEIDPFPAPGSLLTFCPFIQFGDEISNYLIFVNIEKSPVARTSQLEIYDCGKIELKGVFAARNNEATVVALDGLGLTSTDLPLIVCREMSGIPLYFSRTSDGSFLSLEHTHPPASYVIHGRRWEAQKLLKQIWFAKLPQRVAR